MLPRRITEPEPDDEGDASALRGAAPPLEPLERNAWRGEDVAVVLTTVGVLLFLQSLLLITARAPERYRGLDGLLFAVFPTTIGALGVLVRARQRGLGLSALGFVRPKTWRPALAAWVVAIAAGPLFAGVSSVLASVEVTSGGGSVVPLWLTDGRLRQVLLLGAVLAILVPVSEELIFRGLVHRSIRARWPRVPALLLSGLVFGAAHLDPQTVLPLTLVGIALAWSYERSGSLWGAIVPHGGLNFLTVLVLVAGTG